MSPKNKKGKEKKKEITKEEHEEIQGEEKEKLVYITETNYDKFLKKIETDKTELNQEISKLETERKELLGKTAATLLTGVAIGILSIFILDAGWLFWRMQMAKPFIEFYRMIVGLMTLCATCAVLPIYFLRRDIIWKTMHTPFTYRFMIDGHFINIKPLKSAKVGNVLEDNMSITSSEPKKQFLHNNQPAHLYQKGYSEPLELEGNILKHAINADTINSTLIKTLLEDTTLNRLSRKIQKKDAILMILGAVVVVGVLGFLIINQQEMMVMMKGIPGQISSINTAVSESVARAKIPPAITEAIPLGGG